MSEDPSPEPRPYTVRLELIDRPGELLRALEPIADNGGNLLSIFHERGNITPRGHIPVEIDLECPPNRFDDIVGGLREEGINIIKAGAQEFGEEITIILVGPLLETDLSDTISRIEDCSTATVKDLSMRSPPSDGSIASARVRIAASAGTLGEALETVRSIASEKAITVIEPVTAEGVE